MLFPTLENAIWISTAKLQHESGAAEVPVDRIRATLASLFPKQAALSSVSTYLSQVLIASKKRFPNHLNSRVLSGSGSLRHLFRIGDPVHHDRMKAKAKPNREELPESYWYLLDWYEKDYSPSTGAVHSGLPSKADGSGKNWIRFVGLINADDLKVMEEAIDRNCEQVFPSE